MTTSDGSTASYYDLPNGCTRLQDLISHRNMNAQDGEIFRAVYRKGMASHSDAMRDAKKVLFYAQAEVKRLEGSKCVKVPNDGSPWVVWDALTCDGVIPTGVVDVKYSGGLTETFDATGFAWATNDGKYRIIAYRKHKESPQ